MGRIKDKSVNFVDGVHNRTAAEGRARFYRFVMAEEGCTLDEAIEICAGRTDPVQDEYVVGFILSDPVNVMGIYYSGKKQREKYARHLEEGMTPSQIAIFREKVLTESGRSVFKKRLKKERKKHDKDV